MSNTCGQSIFNSRIQVRPTLRLPLLLLAMSEIERESEITYNELTFGGLQVVVQASNTLLRNYRDFLLDSNKRAPWHFYVVYP